MNQPTLPLELGRTGDWVVRAWPEPDRRGDRWGRARVPHRVAAVNGAGVMVPPNPRPTVYWEREGERLLSEIENGLNELGRAMRTALRTAADNACQHCGR